MQPSIRPLIAPAIPPAVHPRKRPYKWLTSVAKIIILCCALLLQSSTENYLLNIVITTHDNKNMTLQQYIDQQKEESISNQWLLVNFWATWCAPCVKELPSLIQLKQRQSATGIAVIAIAVTENSKNVNTFLQKNNIELNFPVAYDPTANSFKKNIKLLPTSFLMNERGVIVEKFVGDKDWQNVFK